jgi:ADP-ribosylglycohydrolase
MLGAIAGDIIGSPWEATGDKRHDFPLFGKHSKFTDDTVMTVAVAHALLDHRDYAEMMREYGRRYPFAGYGMQFSYWLRDPAKGPYNSHGNGGAMRSSPVGYVARSIDDALAEAARSAAPTHNHPEGIKGAQAIALAVFLARAGADKAEIRREITTRLHYDLARTLAQIRPGYRADVSAQGSVPESIIAFLEADSFEAAIRNAVSLGGDTDTMACIAGAIAEAHFGGVPEPIATEVENRLPAEFLQVVERFTERYGVNS